MNVLAVIGTRPLPWRVTAKLAGYQLRDVMRSRWIVAYGLFFFGLTEALLRFGGGSAHAMVSLVNVVLLVVPLVGIVFGTMYLYNARDFVELLLSQPVRRRQLYAGLYVGLSVPLGVAFVLGTAAPFLARGSDVGLPLAALLGAGAFLTLIFVGFAFAISVRFDERVKGLALALGIWLMLTMVYDVLVLLLIQAAADYPLEGAALATMMLNPVDLARVLLLLQLDIAALMGYTGAVLERFFGSAAGVAASGAALLIWAIVPYVLGRVRFTKKDF